MTGTQNSTWAEQTFAPLNNPVFRIIWLAGSASYIGSMVQITSAAWLMTTMTQSALTISLVQTAATLPFVLFALVAGACADMYDRRNQMLVGNILCLVSVLALAGLAFTNLIAPWSLLLLTVLIGTGTVIAAPAWQASVVDMIDRENLTAAISLNNLSFNLARCIGPAIGAEIVVLASAAVSFVANSLSYLFMIFALLRWKNPQRESALRPETVFRAIRDGLDFARLSPAIRVLLLRAILLGFSASTLLAMPPLLAIELQSGARGLGILLVSFGIGAVGGSLSLAWTRARFSADKVIMVNTLLMSTSVLLLGLSNTLWLASVALVFAGLSWIQTMATLQVAAQLSCPRWVVGRTISIFSMSLSLGIALGAIFWGWMASVAGLQVALVSAAAATVTVAGVVKVIPFTQPDDDELHSLENLRPQTVPNVDNRTG